MAKRLRHIPAFHSELFDLVLSIFDILEFLYKDFVIELLSRRFEVQPRTVLYHCLDAVSVEPYRNSFTISMVELSFSLQARRSNDVVDGCHSGHRFPSPLQRDKANESFWFCAIEFSANTCLIFGAKSLKRGPKGGKLALVHPAVTGMAMGFWMCSYEIVRYVKETHPIICHPLFRFFAFPSCMLTLVRRWRWCQEAIGSCWAWLHFLRSISTLADPSGG